MFLGRPAHAKSAQMDGQMDRYRRLHTDVKTYTSLQPIERATAQIQIQIFIFLEAKKIRLSFLQVWRDKIQGGCRASKNKLVAKLIPGSHWAFTHELIAKIIYSEHPASSKYVNWISDVNELFDVKKF